MPIPEPDIPPPPMTIPASPIARDVELVTERALLRLEERLAARSNIDKAETAARIAQLGQELKGPLKRILDELLALSRRVEHLEVRVTAHDAILAQLAPRLAPKRKAKRRAAKRR